MTARIAAPDYVSFLLLNQVRVCCKFNVIHQVSSHIGSGREEEVDTNLCSCQKRVQKYLVLFSCIFQGIEVVRYCRERLASMCWMPDRNIVSIDKNWCSLKACSHPVAACICFLIFARYVGLFSLNSLSKL